MIYPIIVTIALLAVWTTAAYMSVCGMVAVFGGQPIIAGLLAVGMELGKLAAVIHLHRNWRGMSALAKMAYVSVVVVLTSMTAIETGGYLIQSHNAATATHTADRASLDVLTTEEQDLRHRIAIVDDTLAQLPDGHVSRRITERRAAGYDELQQRLAQITAQRGAVQLKLAASKVTAGPVVSLAELSGKSEPTILLAFIAVLVGVMEPLSIGLTIAASAAWFCSACGGPKPAEIERPKSATTEIGHAAETGHGEKSATAETAERQNQEPGETAQTVEITTTAETGRDGQNRPQATAEIGHEPADEFLAIVQRHRLTAETVAEITGRAKLKTVQSWIEGTAEIPVKALRDLRRWQHERPRLAVVGR